MALTLTNQPLTNASQLLLRHLSSLKPRRLLVVEPPDDGVMARLHQQWPTSDIRLFSFDYANYLAQQHRYQQAQLDAGPWCFAAYYNPPEPLHDAAIVFLPKSRPLLQLALSMAAHALAPGSPLLLVGANEAGIRSSRDLLERCIGPTSAGQPGRHCLLYRAQCIQRPPQRHLDDWLGFYAASIGELTIQVANLPGVFSQGELDQGTRFLLEHLALPAAARVLDFGCGAGVIGAVIKARWPTSQVVMLDVSALALAATQRTLAVNGLEATMVAADVFSGIADRFTHIVSNPPFHWGVATDYGVVERFVGEAPQHLEPNGELILVANRFLNYQPLMVRAGLRVRVLAENQRFCIIAGAKP
jgi:16S rRNA (guanine1207-N2)-methyltransferase